MKTEELRLQEVVFFLATQDFPAGITVPINATPTTPITSPRAVGSPAPDYARDLILVTNDVPTLAESAERPFHASFPVNI